MEGNCGSRMLFSVTTMQNVGRPLNRHLQVALELVWSQGRDKLSVFRKAEARNLALLFL